MGCSIKIIVKFGLIAEIITSIIGSIGEFSFRYQAYSLTMDELFGSYYDRNSESISKVSAHQHYHSEWPSNHQHYDHLTGESFQLSQLNAIANTKNNHKNKSDFREPVKIQDLPNQSFISKFFTWVSWLFPYSSSIFDSKNNYLHLDPRPLLMLFILILLNIIFIFAVVMEYLPLIGLMSMTWIFYLILLFVIARVMNDSTTKMMSTYDPSKLSSWKILLPSPFIILVVIIIILFTFILIALITEERRQIAARVRARSACIPLVNSRDMDLDDI